MRIAPLLLTLLFMVSSGTVGKVHAQYANPYIVQEDTTINHVHSPFPDPFQKEKFDNRFQRFTTSRVFQITYIPVGLFVTAGLSCGNDGDFKTTRNFNIPHFKLCYDDYLQYAPGLLTYALKTFGVEGRSSWGRLATSTGISFAFMGLTVNSLKYSVGRERPDGSAKNSFPSGHTSTAFMAATWLHKEYGITRSPLYSVFGYATATSIAISRVMNNKHWLSDVITGAGVGVLSSEMGYYLGDLIYGKNGISSRAINQMLPPIDSKPSFWSFTSGHSTRNNSLVLADKTEIVVKTGLYLATEAAWFFTPHFGFGGKVSLRTHLLGPQNPELIMNRPYFNGSIDYMEPGVMSVYTIQVGPYFSLPVSRRFSIGYSFTGGYSGANASSVLLIKKKANASDPEQSIVAYRSNSNNHFGLETGLSFNTMVSRNMGLKFFTSYALGISRPRYSAIVDIQNDVPVYSTYKNARDASQNFIVGVGINGYFW